MKVVSHRKIFSENAASIKGSLKNGSESPPRTFDFVMASALSYIFADNSGVMVISGCFLVLSPQILGDAFIPRPSAPDASPIFLANSLRFMSNFF